MIKTPVHEMAQQTLEALDQLKVPDILAALRDSAEKISAPAGVILKENQEAGVKDDPFSKVYFTSENIPQAVSAIEHYLDGLRKLVQPSPESHDEA